MADVEALRTEVDGLQLEPSDPVGGSNELLNEVSAGKITGEEERYSRTDLLHRGERRGLRGKRLSRREAFRLAGAGMGLARIGRGTVEMRWSQLGFGRTSSTSRGQETGRNLFGFKDGTKNLRPRTAHRWTGTSGSTRRRGRPG